MRTQKQEAELAHLITAIELLVKIEALLEEVSIHACECIYIINARRRDRRAREKTRQDHQTPAKPP